MRDFNSKFLSGGLEGNYSRRATLPNEIYRMIVGHVADLDYAPKQNILISLSRSSQPLINLAEEYLYMHPRDLDTTQKQRQFLISIRTKSVRSGFVQSLRLLWDSNSANSQLLVDIVNNCFNVKFLLLQRGKDLNDATRVSSDCVATLATILDACRGITSFQFCTTLKWKTVFEQGGLITKHGKELSDLISANPHAIKCLRQLKSLTLSGQSDWVIDGILPYLGSNLTSVFLSQDCDVGSSETPFVDLSRLCPHLRSLVFRRTLDTSDDLEQACKAWGETMEELEISSILDMRDWVSQVMPCMKVLRVLHLGVGCTLFTESIRCIASTESPLEELSLGDILPVNEASEDVLADMNQAIANMINVHASTLQLIEFFCQELGDPVIQACKKVRQLHTLDLHICDSPKSSDIDELLDKCPDLIWFPRWFKRSSARQVEWEERTNTKDNLEERRLRQEPPACGLGT
ncbi:hypothetical protein FSST1_006713 [Fusarium sambucinum]